MVLQTFMQQKNSYARCHIRNEHWGIPNENLRIVWKAWVARHVFPAQLYWQFKTSENKTLTDHQKNFHEDRCTDARTRVVNARIRDETCARAFTTYTRASMHRSS